MASKSNIRSMRFSDDVINLIEAQPGDTFTAKFDALIYHCVQELPEQEKRLKHIQDLINLELARLDSVRRRLTNLEDNVSTLTMNLHTFGAQTQRVVNSINRLVDDCNTN